MLYYYAYFKRADPLLHHLLTTEPPGRLEEAVHLLHLFYIVNPREGLPVAFDDNVEDVSLPELLVEQQQQQQEQLSSISLQQLISLLNVSEKRLFC